MNSRQTGFTLIELLGALAVGSIMLLGMSSMIDTSMDDVKGQQAGLYQATVADAAKKYLTAHYADLKTSVPVASTPATAVSVPTLRDTEHLLSGSFSSTNIYGQSTCVLVTQPIAGKLDALVVTYGGKKIPEKDLKMVAMAAGQGGGYIESNLEDPADTTAYNARGSSWSASTAAYRNVSCAGGAIVLDGTRDNDGGHLASSIFYDGQLFTDFLYRNAYPGRPELNQMNTPIQMANAALVDSGSDCKVGGVANAALAIEKTKRTLMTCGADGKWTGGSSWKEPVNTLASLPATGNTLGDVRMITDKNVAYTFDGTGWVALGVDWYGDLNVPRHITAGGTITGQNLVALNNLSVGGSADVIGGAHFHQHVNVDHDVNAGDNVKAGLDVSAGRDVWAGRNSNVTNDVNVQHDVNLSNNVNVGNDVNVTRDVNIQRDISMSGNDAEIRVLKGGFIGRFTSQGHAEIWDHHKPGDPCNFWKGDGIKSWIEFPQGTLLPDPDGVVMNCYGDNTFRYANGKYTP